jgi:hypothetical protein
MLCSIVVIVLYSYHLHIEQRFNTGCRDYFSKALFFVGEFGVNDYSFIWGAGKTEDEVKSYVPEEICFSQDIIFILNFKSNTPSDPYYSSLM